MPGCRVLPERSASMAPGGRAMASLYAETRSALAVEALPAGSFAYRLPLIFGAPAGRLQIEPSLMHVPVGLSPTSPFSVVTAGSCVLELVSPAPATATNDDSDLRLTSITHFDELVVNFQALSLANAVPAWFFAPVVIVAVYSVLPTRLLAGAKLATRLSAS